MTKLEHSAYEAAMTKVHARQALFVTATGRGTAPDRVEWLRPERGLFGGCPALPDTASRPFEVKALQSVSPPRKHRP